MKGTRRRLRQVRDEDRGASLVEYALLMALIAVVCVAAVTALGGTASGKYDDASAAVGAAGAPATTIPPMNCPPGSGAVDYLSADPQLPHVMWSGPGWYGTDGLGERHKC